MLTSQKSSSLKYLETFTVSETPEVTHQTISDAMFFFLRLRLNLPNTFEAIARYFLGRTVNCEGDTNDFIRDKWVEPSIKDSEREDRGSLRGIYSIKGLAKRRP